MKKALLVVALGFLVFACKKRQEFPVQPVPTFANIRIAEVADTLVGHDTTIFEKTNYFYDAYGLMIKREGKHQIDSFIYHNGLLAESITRNRNYSLGLNIVYDRNQNNDIISWKYKYANFIAGTIHYQNNQPSWIKLNPSKEPNIYYSDHTMRRAEKVVHVYHPSTMDSGTIRVEYEIKRTLDLEGRVLRADIIDRSYKIDTLANGEFSYILKSVGNGKSEFYYLNTPALREFRARITQQILQHYCRNLDLGEYLQILPPDLDELLKAEISVSYRKAVDVRRLNKYELPTLVYITDDYGNYTKRGIKYYID